MSEAADIHIRKQDRAGRITLNRPRALNALTYDMVTAIEGALDLWATDDDVDLLIIDAAGDKAFCAGGDIADLYATGSKGDFAWGQQFWRDEYRMNAKAFEFPKPYVSFMQGFVMGGGVGVSCHGSHRIVCESSKIAMPECSIGLVPDVGGSLVLAQAPGRLGEYLGATADRMGPGDAILVGFADYFIPEAAWEDLKTALCETGDWSLIDAAATAPPEGKLPSLQADIDRHFGGETLGDILRSLRHDGGEFARNAESKMAKNSPLSVGCAVEMIHRLRNTGTMRTALELEYRFTARAMEFGDFLEGIRARIIDKDNAPAWRHDGLDGLRDIDVTKMLMPLGAMELKLAKELS